MPNRRWGGCPETGAKPMTGQRKDRRVARTRRALHEALRSLILEKGYDRVTVQDVIDRADVGRATFYAHFRGKDDLLRKGFEEMRQSLRRQLTAAPRAPAGGPGLELGFTRVLFEHVAGHRREYRAQVGSRSGGAILETVRQELTALIRARLEEILARRRAKPVVPAEIATHYVVSALLAVLTWWLDRDLPYPAEQMAQMFERLTGPAVAAALAERAESEGA